MTAMETIEADSVRTLFTLIQFQNPFGRYGNPYSYENLMRRYGVGIPYSTEEFYIVPIR